MLPEMIPEVSHQIMAGKSLNNRPKDSEQDSRLRVSIVPCNIDGVLGGGISS
jgi:hypothetical protein